MKKLDFIKQKFGYYFLKKETAKLKRKKAFHNFDSAKTAGIIFNATHQDLYNLAKNFMNFLASKNIQVFGLGYVNSREAMGYFPFQKGVDYFPLNELNWFAKPKSTDFEKFINEPFDLLIDISLADTFPIHYAIGMSKAKCRIAPLNEKVNYADFSIDVKNNQNSNYFIDQLKHYMTAISKY